MKVLDNPTLDKLINLYEGKIVQDKVNIERHQGSPVLPPRVFEKALAQDKMILGALKCAKANGYSGEE